MEKFYSKTQPGILLHIVNRKSDITGRKDIIDPDQFLQCSSINLDKGSTFRPHRHIWKKRDESLVIAQESWVVISGSVKCFFYDLDDSLLAEVVLHPGDASYTIEGGHNYEILEDGTFVYEFKVGPYEGQSLDKHFIN